MRATAEAPVESARFEVDLDDVETALLELLRGYRIALQFAADMPLLGRSGRVKHRWGRWGSRFFTRVYVEAHVRKQLQSIRDCLRLERLGRQERAEAKRIVDLEEELEKNLQPLFRWRRLAGLIARLPPLAALVLPVLSAASLWPGAKDVSLFRFLLVIALVALVLWALVVWPSVRLGFRVKRVIFVGGVDYERPFRRPLTKVSWEGFAAPSFYNDEPEGRPRPFPPLRIYDAENAVYRALGRRKPAEVPLDLLLAFAPYIWFAYSVFFVYGFVDAVVEGELWQAIKDSGFGLFLGAVLAAGAVGFPLEGRKSYRERPH